FESPEGERAELLRQVVVPNYEWFALAMADGVFGHGPKIDGMDENNSVDIADELYLHGRAVGYLKGRIRGDSLLANNPFKTFRVTAHVDTGRKGEADIARQLIDPDRYYPVYGDASEEVQDVSSRERVYVLLQADDSFFVLGNFKASMQGIEL